MSGSLESLLDEYSPIKTSSQPSQPSQEQQQAAPVTHVTKTTSGVGGGSAFNDLLNEYSPIKQSATNAEQSRVDDNGDGEITIHAKRMNKAPEQKVSNPEPTETTTELSDIPDNLKDDPNVFAVRNKDGSISWHSPNREMPASNTKNIAAGLAGGLAAPLDMLSAPITHFTGEGTKPSDFMNDAVNQLPGGYINKNSTPYHLGSGAGTGVAMTAALGPLGEVVAPAIKGTGVAANVGRTVAEGLADMSPTALAGAVTGGASSEAVDHSSMFDGHPILRSLASIGAGLVGGSAPAFLEHGAKSAVRGLTGVKDAVTGGGEEAVNIPGVNGAEGTTKQFSTKALDRASQFLRDNVTPESAEAINNGAVREPLAGEHITPAMQVADVTGSPANDLTRLENGVRQNNPTTLDAIDSSNANAHNQAVQSLLDNYEKEFDSLENKPSGLTLDNAVGQSQQKNITNAQAVKESTIDSATNSQAAKIESLPGNLSNEELGNRIASNAQQHFSNTVDHAAGLIRAAYDKAEDSHIPTSHPIAVLSKLIDPERVGDGPSPKVGTNVTTFLRSHLNDLKSAGSNISPEGFAGYLKEISDKRNSLSTFGSPSSKLVHPDNIATEADVKRLTDYQNAMLDAFEGKLDTASQRTLERSAVSKAAYQGRQEAIKNNTLNEDGSYTLPKEVADAVREGAKPAKGAGEGAGQELQAARRNFAQTMSNFRNSQLASRLLDKDKPTSALPAYLFNGNGALSRFNEYKTLVPEGRAVTDATEAMFSRLRSINAITQDNQINPKLFAQANSGGTKVLKQMQEMGLTDAVNHVNDARKLQDSINNIAANHDLNIKQLQDQAASKFIGRSPQEAIQDNSILGKGANIDHKNRRQFNELIDQVQNDPNAMAALRHHTLNWLQDAVKGSDGNVDSTKLGNILDVLTTNSNNTTNRNPLTRLLNGQGVQRLRQVYSATVRSQKAKGAGRITPESAGYDGHDINNAADTVLLFDAMKHLFGGIGGLTGHGMAASFAAGAATKAGIALKRQTFDRMVSATKARNINDFNGLMNEAVIHPEVFKTLWNRVPANKEPSSLLMRRLSSALVKSAANNTVIIPNGLRQKRKGQ